jgi:hypothetical protein
MTFIMSEPITGYRTLTTEEIALIDSINEIGKTIGVLVDQLEAMESTDKRWLAIGKTGLQQGMMAITRSVAKPTTF